MIPCYESLSYSPSDSRPRTKSTQTGYICIIRHHIALNKVAGSKSNACKPGEMLVIRGRLCAPLSITWYLLNRLKLRAFRMQRRLDHIASCITLRVVSKVEVEIP